MRRIELLAFCVWTAVSLAAQDRPEQIMTGSADLLWNVTVQVTTVLEPPLKSPEFLGLEGGIRADGDKVHRYIVDKVNHAYFGYDLVLVFENHGVAQSPARNRRHSVSIRPLSIVPQESGFAGGKLLNPVGLRKYPESQEVEDGDTIVLDVLASPSGQQKVVDYIRISTKPDPGPANPNLVPQDFTVDDGPITIKLPFKVYVNGKEFQGHTIGWHIDVGSTIWLGLPGRGMYILSLVPREGYNFQKAGAIRNHVIAFHDGDTQYEIRTSGPVAGLDRAWNLYVLHEPAREMKGPLFGVDRLGSCTLGFLRGS